MPVSQRNTPQSFAPPRKSRPPESLRTEGLRSEPDRDAWTCGSCEATNEGSSLLCHACEGRLPVIALFTAALHSDATMEEYVLKWEVFEADSVLLTPGNMIIPAQGSLNLKPEWQEGDVFTIVANNDIGTRQLSTRVTVSPPRIHSFKAADSRIQIGYPTILHWEVENAAKLHLNMEIGEVTGSSFTEVYLEKPGTCVLTATNAAGVVKVEIELSLGLPEIVSFYSGTDRIQLNAPVPLFWEVNNASKVFIDPVKEDLLGQTQIELFPDRTTTYTLRAINFSGEVSQQIEVFLPPPRIRQFGAETGISTEGEAIELSWDVENAYQVHISEGIGEVGLQGKVKVKPQHPFTEYIFARNWAFWLRNSVF